MNYADTSAAVDPLLVWGFLLLLLGTAAALAGLAWMRAERAVRAAFDAEAVAAEALVLARETAETVRLPRVSADDDTAAYADLAAAAVRDAGRGEEPPTQELLVPGLRPTLPRPGMIR